MHVEGFASERPGHGTNLFEPLNQAPEKFRNLRAVVLASDGDWNVGKPPVQAADLLRQKGISVLCRSRRQSHATARRRSPQRRRADLRRRRQGRANPLYDREFALPRIRHDGDAAHLGRPRPLEGSPHRPDGPHERLDSLEADGDRRFHRHAGRAHASRGDADRQQQASGSDCHSRRKAARAGRRVVSAVGVPVPAQRPVARSGRRSRLPVVSSRAEQGRRRQ